MSEKPVTKTGVWSRRLQIASTVAFATVGATATTWNINEPGLPLLVAASSTLAGSLAVTADKMTIEWLQQSLGKPRHSFLVLLPTLCAVYAGISLSLGAHDLASGRIGGAAMFTALGIGSALLARFGVRTVWKKIDGLRLELDKQEAERELAA